MFCSLIRLVSVVQSLNEIKNLFYKSILAQISFSKLNMVDMRLIKT